MMYYCEDCGEIFDEDDIKYEDESFQVEYWGSMVTCPASSAHCPYCNSEDIDEASKCDECGEYFNPDDLDEDGLCEDCREENKEEEDVNTTQS